VREREQNGAYVDFPGFLTRLDNVSMNKRVLESLIFAGAFDCLGQRRSQLIAVYENVADRVLKDKTARLSGQFSFFDNETFNKLDSFTYPDIREYSSAQKLKFEREVTGVYLSGHPLDEYTEKLKEFKYNSSFFASSTENGDDENESVVRELLPDGTVVVLGGMLVEASKRLTKNGKELGLGRLEDLYGTIELMCFGGTLQKYKTLWMPDKLVTITGRVRNRDGALSIWVEKMEPWANDDRRAADSKKICFYLSFKNSDESAMDKIREVLGVYPGGDDAYVKDTDSGKLYNLGIRTGISEHMLNELCGIVGEDNIKVVG
jgi:DNA polymerase-3 subunit alpha